MALKKQHKARWNCNMGKYQPGRGTWPTPQNGKWPYLKFRLGTYIPQPPPPPPPPHTCPTLRQTYAWLCLISHCIFCSLFLYFCTEVSWQYNAMHKFARALDNPPVLWHIHFPLSYLIVLLTKQMPNKVIVTSLSHLDTFCTRCQNDGKPWKFIRRRQSSKQNGKVRILLKAFLAIHFRFYVFLTPGFSSFWCRR